MKKTNKKRKTFASAGMKYHDQNSDSNQENKLKAGFTLIELIVVMAIIAILVLLAAPRFLNKTQQAKDTKITNDIKVVESLVEEYLIKHDKLDSTWTEKMPVAGDNLYDTTGPLGTSGTVEAGSYRLLDSEILEPANTQLGGKFYGNDKGRVYYEDDKATPSAGDNGADTPIVKTFNDSEVSGVVALTVEKTIHATEAAGWMALGISYTADGKIAEYIPTVASGLDSSYPFSQDDWNNFYTYYLKSVEATSDYNTSQAAFDLLSPTQFSNSVADFTQIKKDSVIFKVVPERKYPGLPGDTDNTYVLDASAAAYIEVGNIQKISTSSISVDMTFMNKDKEVMNTQTVCSDGLYIPYTYSGKDWDGYAYFDIEAVPITSNFSDYSLYVYENTSYGEPYQVSTIKNTLE